METSLYAPSGNPCTYLLGNALCYIISGMMLLVVGVIITSLTFQNLEAYKDENKERYAGPVLIGAGVLVLARGAFSRLRPQRAPSGRRRSFLQRYVREVYNRPILAVTVHVTLIKSSVHEVKSSVHEVKSSVHEVKNSVCEVKRVSMRILELITPATPGSVSSQEKKSRVV
ncbi:hypothetical protein C0Q70_01280 [Pomacea canaliculata]|uniref:Uncharacterized protein n=1 Tax=Pomacea canaliculata TaxID=400727 RepID=A0A2T7PZ19_POMCA|nr:hypothetical protein C0Q70_01280 [Pomacea canaliculata]